MEKGSKDLLAVCKGYTRTQKYVLGTRPFFTLAHGLYCLAQILLPKDVFRELEMLNRIFEAPPAKVILWQPQLDSPFNIIKRSPPALWDIRAGGD